MKRYQAINREKFLARWGAEIADWGVRGEDLERTKERWVRRRALVVDNYMPTPDRESGSLRLVNLFRILQDLGYKVTFGAANLEAPEPYVSRLQGQGVECLYRPYVRSLRRHLAAQGALYDLVILSRADAAAAVMPHARRHCPNARILYDTVDLHFLREQRLAELTGDRAIRRLAEQRRAQELGLIDAADATLVVSEAELRLLRMERPGARLHLVSNIHRIPGSAAPFGDRKDCLFIGAFAHPPNGDAVRWLAREILPLVWAELPDLHCHVIGADPPPDIRALAGPGLILHGYVPDVAPYFKGCRLSVAPLRYGAGVKGKVNQSLAHGLPVVVTSQAAEGMFLVDGESALIADEPADFAAAIVRLHRDEALWTRLSAGGLQVMEDHFSFAAARRAIEEVVGG
jgi:glycosyltransferase involved in cell wall biosynthesis